MSANTNSRNSHKLRLQKETSCLTLYSHCYDTSSLVQKSLALTLLNVLTAQIVEHSHRRLHASNTCKSSSRRKYMTNKTLYYNTLRTTIAKGKCIGAWKITTLLMTTSLHGSHLTKQCHTIISNNSHQIVKTLIRILCLMLCHLKSPHPCH